MSKFEFIMMFVSVVVVFAMAELLMSWGRIIRNRQRISQPWLLAYALMPDFSETWLQRLFGTIVVSLSVIWLFFTRNIKVHLALMIFNLTYLLTVSVYFPVRGLTAF